MSTVKVSGSGSSIRRTSKENRAVAAVPKCTFTTKGDDKDDDAVVYSLSIGDAVEIKTSTNLPDFGSIVTINNDSTYDIDNTITGCLMKSVRRNMIAGSNEISFFDSLSLRRNAVTDSYKPLAKKAKEMEVITTAIISGGFYQSKTTKEKGSMKQRILPSLSCWVTTGHNRKSNCKTERKASIVDQEVLNLLEHGVSLRELENKICIQWDLTSKQEQVPVSSVYLDESE